MIFIDGLLHCVPTTDWFISSLGQGDGGHARVLAQAMCAGGSLSPRTGPAKSAVSQWDDRRTPEPSQIKMWEGSQLMVAESQCDRARLQTQWNEPTLSERSRIAAMSRVLEASKLTSIVSVGFVSASSALFGYPSLGLPAHSRRRFASPGSKGNDLACETCHSGLLQTRRVRLRDLP